MIYWHKPTNTYCKEDAVGVIYSNYVLAESETS